MVFLLNMFHTRSWYCFIGSCWKELTAVDALNTVFNMARQLQTQSELNSYHSTLSTCMLICIQVGVTKSSCLLH